MQERRLSDSGYNLSNNGIILGDFENSKAIDIDIAVHVKMNKEKNVKNEKGREEISVSMHFHSGWMVKPNMGD